MKKSYNYIIWEYKKYWINDVSSSDIKYIFLNLLQLSSKDFIDFSKRKDLDITIKVIIKYIYSNWWEKLLNDILLENK
jgi:hypothetical protein